MTIYGENDSNPEILKKLPRKISIDLKFSLAPIFSCLGLYFGAYVSDGLDKAQHKIATQLEDCVEGQSPDQHLTESQLDCIDRIDDQELLVGIETFTSNDQVRRVRENSLDIEKESHKMDFLEFIVIPGFSVIGYFVGKNTLSTTVSIKDPEE